MDLNSKFVARYPHFAARLYGAPWAIHPAKHSQMCAALHARVGLSGPVADDGEDFEGDEETESVITPAGLAVVPVEGVLVERSSWLGAMCGLTSYDQLQTRIGEAMTDSRVKAVLLAIRSPGGECAGLWDFLTWLEAQAQAKPFFAYANRYAFSAAQAIASVASQTYLPRDGRLGSIGVVSKHVEYSRMLEEQGITTTYLYRGARKVDGNEESPLSPEAAQATMDDIGTLYSWFVDTVARGRRMEPAAVMATEAACYMGQKGVDVGLADGIATLSELIGAIEAQLPRT
jgi:ClpP class serine protease